MIESSRTSYTDTAPLNIITRAWFICVLLMGGVCFSSDLHAQALERKPGYLIGGEIGFSNVATEIGAGEINDTGPTIGIRMGRRFSDRFSLMLEFSVHHFNDETPQTSDLRVDTTIVDGREIYGVSFIKNACGFANQLPVIVSAI